ncbi:hypothetical protein NEOLI_000019 [Neolecta irregularis DAH-3]|uniref:Uncharacterized protein n=1 Tax=Neolecta irregularis (strain DAH-3) TaxID=1198029 RepID=A0A1U7LWJ0_NEOID|nr:hypothetical protein NEOLI_000019 [Neolecta irregularis DAH-3]|eukprot:OLL27004.1 hypothetical protein NEOLI_000019 [Neolecta irregularis DAH-3]
MLTVVGALHEWSQIGIKQNYYQSPDSRDGHNGRLFNIATDTLEEAAIICLHLCQKYGFFAVVIIGIGDQESSCFFPDQRFLGFEQDDSTLVPLDIPQRELPQVSRISLVIGDSIALFPRWKSTITRCIQRKNYYAFKVIPSFPTKHNLQNLSSVPSSGLNFIRDIDSFQSLNQWRIQFDSLAGLGPTNVQNEIVLRWRRGIEMSIFTPPTQISSHWVGNDEWKKPQIINMISHILDKTPLDASMVYAYASTMFRDLYREVETPEDTFLPIATRRIQNEGFQVVQLSGNHWLTVKWISHPQGISTLMYSTRDIYEADLAIPEFRRFINRIENDLQPRQPVVVYRNCPENDEAFCAIFLTVITALSIPPLGVFYEGIPDDFRLYMAYNLMQQFGFTGEEVDQRHQGEFHTPVRSNANRLR